MTKTMKALVKAKPEEGIWLEEVPIPQPKENEVLIRTKKTSICGTDIHIYQWDSWAKKNVPPSLVIGHEFVGEVIEVGKAVTHVRVGDRVSGEGHLTCSHCPNCLMGNKHLCQNTRGVGYHVHGCFAEFFTLPEENVFILPDNIPDDIAAIFDPLGNATHTALSFDLVGEDVLITGAGPIGIMAAAICRYAGAHRVIITDINEYRLDLAKKMGVTRAINVKKENLEEVMKEENINHGFTVALEMSGSPLALSSILETSRNGAKIGLLGILPPRTAVDWDHVIFKMLEIKGIYGREIFSTWFKMTHMLQGGLDILPVITHHFPIDEFQKGFDVMLSRQSGKVILSWEGQ